MAIPKLCTIDRYCMNIGTLRPCGCVSCDEHTDSDGQCAMCACFENSIREERYRHEVV
jgi:hypothetical protein